ncbi:MAG: ABC transporter permease [Flavobacterium sp.]|nr:MAG: ABC transporter permease [Flavobacterium sp.]
MLSKVELAIKKHLPLLIDLTKRDFKLRYLGSILGSYWNLIHPLVMILIYTMIFSRVMHSRLGDNAGPYDYSLYLCSGIFAWNLFSEVVTRGSGCLIENAGFIKKIALSPVTLFGAAALSAMVTFAIAFGIFFVFLLLVKSIFISKLIAYLIVVLAILAFAFGISLGLGCLNVFIRDIQPFLGVLFQLWFWFTPLVYLTSSLSPFAQKLLNLNPIFPFIESLHRLLFFDQWPLGLHVALMVFWTTLSLSLGAFIYRRSLTFVKDQL